jgi:predicted membrane protein
MMESTTNKSLLWSILALAVMAGSGWLLGWSISVLSLSVGSELLFIIVLAAVPSFIAGATWMGHILGRDSGYGKYGGKQKGISFALLVIGMGVLWLCLNGGVFPAIWKPFFISWPMLLFVVGCIELCKIRYVSGIILASIGIIFLLPLFPGTSFDRHFLTTWWPVFLIMTGILIFFSILLKPKRVRWSHQTNKQKWNRGYSGESGANQDGVINYDLVFSGIEQVVLDPVFKGGHVSAVFGGMELDLRRTSLAENETVLHIETVFGGVNIKAPAAWNIEIHSESVFGGVTDKRVMGQERDMTRKLVIVAEAVFGGVTIVS